MQPRVNPDTGFRKQGFEGLVREKIGRSVGMFKFYTLPPRERIHGQKETSSGDPRLQEVRFGTGLVRGRSELEAQGELHFSGIFYRTSAAAIAIVRWARIGSRKDMPIKCVDQLRLENKTLGLVNLCAFYDGEILVDVAVTSNLAGNSGK